MSARVRAFPVLPPGWTLRRPAGDGEWVATHAGYAITARGYHLSALVLTVHELAAKLAAEEAAKEALA